ncbi:MAG TPA: ATP-binding protein [Planctomycetota bacterium]
MAPTPLRDMPLPKKLRLIVLVVSSVALLGAFAIFLIYQWVTSWNDRLVQLKVMAAIVAEQSTAALEFDQKDQARTLLASLRSEPEIVAAALYDKKDRLFAPYATPGGPAVPDQARPEGHAYEGGDLIIQQAVTSAGERVGTLYLRSDLRFLWARLWVNLGAAALVLGAAGLAVLALSARLGRWITVPVLRLAEVVRSVSAKKDYSIRAEPHGRDELGLLIEGFNDMLSQVQARDEALARARGELEIRVEERTRELTEEVAERRQAEEKLKEKDARLSEAQQIARLGSWDWDPETGRVTWSDEMYRIHGLLPAGFAGTLEAYLKLVHPDDRGPFKEKLEDAVKRRGPFAADHQIIRPDGEVRALLAHGKVVLDDAGRPVRFVGVTQDITDRRRAEEAVRELNRKLQDGMDELAAANKELEGFSYSVSHDLRAPLRAIDGFSRMLIEDCAGRLDEKGSRYVNVIRTNTQRMGQLIDDLLAFSRMGRKQVVPSPIDMEALAKSAYAEVVAIYPGRKLDFRLGALPPCHGDVSMMRQVFANLLANAVKYSRDRDPAVIEVQGQENGAEMIYSVRDNGVGFEMEYANKLFGVFQRLHSAKEFEGTGVGLALVQRIIQRHGGRIWGEGKVDHGAVFTFTLPKKEADHAQPGRNGDSPGGGQSG